MAALKAKVLDHFKNFLIANFLINSVLRRVVTRRFQIGKKRVVLVADSESLKFLKCEKSFYKLSGHLASVLDMGGWLTERYRGSRCSAQTT